MKRISVIGPGVLAFTDRIDIVRLVSSLGHGWRVYGGTWMMQYPPR